MSRKDVKHDFLCPACGGSEPLMTTHISPSFDSGRPSTHILMRITCGNCENSIPAHLAERWGGISIADAKTEWLNEYCESAPRTEI